MSEILDEAMQGYIDSLNEDQLRAELAWNHAELRALAVQRAELDRQWVSYQEHQTYIVKRLGEYATNVVPDVAGKDL